MDYIQFSIDNPKLISVNEQYLHPVKKTKSGRYTSYFCKSPYLKEVQSFYESELKDKISDEDVDKVKKYLEDKPKESGIVLDIIILIPAQEIYDHDVTNYIKALEDCIAMRLGIDDSRNYLVKVMKAPSTNWKLYATIYPDELPKDYLKD